MTRLFRDWRFALLWVIGISALVTAYFAQGGGHEDLIAQPAAGATATAAPVQQPVRAAPATTAIAEDSGQFGEPVLDTTPPDPNPPEPAEARASETPASEPAPATP